MRDERPLFSATRLNSALGRTSIDLRNLMVFYATDLVDMIDEDGAIRRRPRKEDNLHTMFHEGLHWRQLHGTTTGMFLSWIRHGREVDLLEKLKRLDASDRERLRAIKARGDPLIALDDEDRPDPAFRLDDPVEPLELMKCIYFDLFLTDRMVFRSDSIRSFYASPGEIFASAVADAARALTPAYHPDWSDLDYRSVRKRYLVEGRFQALRLDDPGFVAIRPSKRDLSCADLLEAQATANELFFMALIEEVRFHAEGDDAETGPLGVVTPRELPAGGLDLRDHATRFLDSEHGLCARVLFEFADLHPFEEWSWIALLVACDIALNPPLPPACPPPATPPVWWNLLPPLRFARLMHVLRAGAVEPVGLAAALADPEAIARLRDRLVAASGLDYVDVARLKPNPRPPEFVDVVAQGREGRLYREFTYYDFLLYAQNRFMHHLRFDADVVGYPAFSIYRKFNGGNPEAAVLFLQNLGVAPLVMTDAEHGFGHGFGSSPQLGSWFSVSLMFYGAIDDLMFGGARSSLGFPDDLANAAWPLIEDALRDGVGYDPWSGPTARHDARQ